VRSAASPSLDGDALRHRSVRRVTAALVLTAVAAFAIVGTATALISKRIARDDALAEATRTAQNIADILFAPAMPAVLRHDAAAIARLDAVVAERHATGLIVRVKVWARDGTVIYSDEKSAVGNRYPLDEDVRRSIDSAAATADVSALDAEENVTELGLGDELVEVYTPMRLADGRRLAFELYMDLGIVHHAEARLLRRTMPLALAALLVLLVLQLPLSVWLVRRVGRNAAERAELLRRILAVSEIERRSVAHDLHDGPVQDLAGAGLALSSVASSIGPDVDPDAGRLMSRAIDAVHSATDALRTLIVDIYPPDLGLSGMHQAIENLARPLAAAGVTVAIDVSAGAAAADASDGVGAMLYRCAREALTNVDKHAAARHVLVTLELIGAALVLTVEDDGVGPAGGASPERNHFGLRLLGDAVEGMGGRLRFSGGPAGGARLVVELPVHAARPL